MTGPQGELGARGPSGKPGTMGFQGELGIPGIPGKTGVPVREYVSLKKNKTSDILYYAKYRHRLRL